MSVGEVEIFCWGGRRRGDIPAHVWTVSRKKAEEVITASIVIAYINGVIPWIWEGGIRKRALLMDIPEYPTGKAHRHVFRWRTE